MYVRRTLAKIGIGSICRIIGIKDIRYQWLSHYLVGNGDNLHIPRQLIQDELNREIAVQAAGEPFRFNSAEKIFWLVGTMTWSIKETPAGQVVRGLDRYDWHPNRFLCPECGAWGYDIEGGICNWCDTEAVPDWWWSPTGIPGWVARLLRAVWPECRPYVDVGDTGYLSVSNGFWPWLGGKEFFSILEIPLGLLPSWNVR